MRAMIRQICFALSFTFLTIGSSIPSYSAPIETIDAGDIITASSSLSCIDWRISGVCFFLFCTTFGCSIETSIQVTHFNPDLVVTAYDNIVDANGLSDTPWDEARGLYSSLENNIHRRTTSAVYGLDLNNDQKYFAGASINDSGNGADADPKNLVYKDTQVIGGIPVIGLVAQTTGFPFFCPANQTIPFFPYFLSGVDSFAWRSGITELIYPGTWIPTIRNINDPANPGVALLAGLNSIFVLWGSIHPRQGFQLATEDPKMGAVAAAKAAHIATRRVQPHIYIPTGPLREAFTNISFSDLDLGLDEIADSLLTFFDLNLNIFSGLATSLGGVGETIDEALVDVDQQLTDGNLIDQDTVTNIQQDIMEQAGESFDEIRDRVNGIGGQVVANVNNLRDRLTIARDASVNLATAVTVAITTFDVEDVQATISLLQEPIDTFVNADVGNTIDQYLGLVNGISAPSALAQAAQTIQAVDDAVGRVDDLLGFLQQLTFFSTVLQFLENFRSFNETLEQAQAAFDVVQQFGELQQQFGDIQTLISSVQSSTGISAGEFMGNQGYRIVPPPSYDPNNEESGKWQMLSPVAEDECGRFGENDSLNFFNGYTDRVWPGEITDTALPQRSYDYSWNLWREYTCCQRRGAFLFAIDFQSGVTR